MMLASSNPNIFLASRPTESALIRLLMVKMYLCLLSRTIRGPDPARIVLCGS